MGSLCGGNDFFICRVQSAVPDILHNGTLKQPCVLQHHAERFPQLVAVEVPHIMAVQQDRTAADIIAGASHLITQLFFDNDSFYDFRYRAARAGVNVPIEAGIMPVTNRKQIERMVTMCGASLPRKFTKMVQRFEDNPEALRDAGIAYAIDQIVDLVTDGVDGIHLYTMNNPYVARKISEAVSGIIKAAPKC